MKKAFTLIFLFSYIFLTCEAPKMEEENQIETEQDVESIIHKIGEGNLEVLEIEDCEYFFLKDHLNANQGFGFMAHKGNCKNPIHCHNQLKGDTLSPNIEVNH